MHRTAQDDPQWCPGDRAGCHDPGCAGAGADGAWGVSVEAARVAQVFITDSELRKQLEAEIRNEIRLQADRSDLTSKEAIQLARLASEGRVLEQRLTSDQDAVQRQEAMALAELARERRMQTELLATERQALELEQERFHAKATIDQDRLDTETPVRLQAIEIQAGDPARGVEAPGAPEPGEGDQVERDMLLDRARQDMRLEMLPIEQGPQIVEAASKVLNGTNLSIYGEGAEVMGGLAPMFELLTRAVRQSTRGTFETTPEPTVPA